MTIETSKNLEKIQVSDQVHLEERPRDNGGFRSSDSRNDNDRTFYGEPKSTTPSEQMKASEAFLCLKEVKHLNRGNDAVRSGGFRSQGQENKASESRCQEMEEEMVTETETEVAEFTDRKHHTLHTNILIFK